MPRPRSKLAHKARGAAADALRAYQDGERDPERLREALAALFLTNVNRSIVERWGRMRRGVSGDVLCWRDLVGELCPCDLCRHPDTFDAWAAREAEHARPPVFLVATSSVRAASEGAPLRRAVGGYLTRYALAYVDKRIAELRAEGIRARVYLLTGEGAQDPDELATARAWHSFDDVTAEGRADEWLADVTEATRGADVELHAGRGWFRLAGRPEHWKQPVTGRPDTRAAWYRARVDLE